MRASMATTTIITIANSIISTAAMRNAATIVTTQLFAPALWHPKCGLISSVQFYLHNLQITYRDTKRADG